jgi:hypothetical protein
MGDLIERLREKHENEVIYRQEYHLEVCAEAADALEAKDAEIARLREALGGHQLWTHAENVEGEFVLWAETGEVLMRLKPTHRHQNMEPAAVEFVLGDLLDLLNARAALAEDDTPS